MSVKNPASEIKKLRGLVAMALRRGAVALNLQSASKNRSQSFATAGSVVLAGGAISTTVGLTPVSSGKILVSAWLSYAAPAASGTARALVTSTQASTTVTRAVLAPTIGGGAVVLEVDGFTVGVPMTWSFVTVAGDASITLGTGASGAGAGLSVQELP